MEFRPNDRYEILTPEGWRGFYGIRKNFSDTIEIFFGDGGSIVVTRNHKFVHDGEIREADTFNIGEYINDRKIVEIKTSGFVDVYDPVEVEENHLYLSNGLISHNCKFQGGTSTLISGEKLASLPASRPIAISETLKIYEEPDKSKSYVMTVDTARGLGGDYSAFVIFDVTTLPYKIVAVYRDNKISPILYPGLILKMATHYNTAAVLIENNDMGESISNSLYFELEYDMVIKSHENVISSFGGRTPGFKTTKKSKSLGCSTLKTLVEGDKLDIRDSDIIYELSNFVAKGSSFEADVGNDDLAMCLVMFSYLTIQPAMEDFTSVSAKNQILIERMKMAEEEMMPVGGFTDGTEQELDVMNF